jgi:hypothetical protein
MLSAFLLFSTMAPNRSPLTLTIVATLIAWFVWFLTIARLDPATAGAIGYTLFYLALFCAVGGSATIVGLFVRRQHSDPSHTNRIAIRQGALTGLAVAVAVLLQSKGLLTWVNLLFLIIALTLLELFIISLRPRHQYTNPHESTNTTV